MTNAMRVYVNERAVDVPQGAVAGTAVGALDPELGSAVAQGRAYLTDGRGIRVAADTPLTPGAILRVVRPARQPASDDGGLDADP